MSIQFEALQNYIFLAIAIVVALILAKLAGRVITHLTSKFESRGNIPTGLVDLVAVAAFSTILLARVLSVYPIIGITSLLGEKITSSWTKVLATAGLRG